MAKPCKVLPSPAYQTLTLAGGGAALELDSQPHT